MNYFSNNFTRWKKIIFFFFSYDLSSSFSPNFGEGKKEGPRDHRRCPAAGAVAAAAAAVRAAAADLAAAVAIAVIVLTRFQSGSHDRKGGRDGLVTALH